MFYANVCEQGISSQLQMMQDELGFILESLYKVLPYYINQFPWPCATMLEHLSSINVFQQRSRVYTYYWNSYIWFLCCIMLIQNLWFIVYQSYRASTSWVKWWKCIPWYQNKAVSWSSFNKTESLLAFHHHRIHAAFLDLLAAVIPISSILLDPLNPSVFVLDICHHFIHLVHIFLINHIPKCQIWSLVHQCKRKGI